MLPVSVIAWSQSIALPGCSMLSTHLVYSPAGEPTKAGAQLQGGEYLQHTAFP